MSLPASPTSAITSQLRFIGGDRLLQTAPQCPWQVQTLTPPRPSATTCRTTGGACGTLSDPVRSGQSGQSTRIRALRRPFTWAKVPYSRVPSRGGRGPRSDVARVQAAVAAITAAASRTSTTCMPPVGHNRKRPARSSVAARPGRRDRHRRGRRHRPGRRSPPAVLRLSVRQLDVPQWKRLSTIGLPVPRARPHRYTRGEGHAGAKVVISM